MLSTRKEKLNIKEIVKSIQTELARLKSEFYVFFNKEQYGEDDHDPQGQKQIAIHSQLEAIGKQIANLITSLALTKGKVDPDLVELSAQNTALILSTYYMPYKVEPDTMVPIITESLDTELFQINTYFRSHKIDDINTQEAIYNIFLFHRLINANHKKADQQASLANLPNNTGKKPLAKSSDAGRFLTSLMQKEPFIPEKFLFMFVSQSSNSYIKLLAIRSLWYECAMSNPRMLQHRIQYSMNGLEESFKQVANKPVNIKPKTIAEYQELFELIFANFIYYQLKVIAIQGYYQKKVANTDLFVDCQSNNDCFDVILFKPILRQDASADEIENFISKEEELRKYYDASITLAEHIDFSLVPINHFLLEKLSEIIENCVWNASSYSVMSVILLANLNYNQHSSNPSATKIVNYCEQLKIFFERWSGIGSRFRSECLKRSVSYGEKNSHDKKYVNHLEDEEQFKAKALNKISSLADSQIKYQCQKANKLKIKADNIAAQFSKNASKRNSRFQKSVNAQSTKKSVITVKVDDQLCDSIIFNSADSSGQTSNQKENIVIARLEILDSRLNLFGRGLVGRLKRISQLLNDRVQAKKPMRDGGMVELEESLKMSVDDLNQLIKLRMEYEREIAKAGDLKEHTAAAQFSVEDINELISTSRSMLVESMDLVQDILNRSIQDRNDYIIRLGKQEAAKKTNGESGDSNASVYTHEQIYQMGWERFAATGREKRNKGLPISNISLERQFMESLLKVYIPRINPENVELIFLQHGVPTVSLPELARWGFQLLEPIPMACYLVGGAAICILTGRKLDSCVDLDFTTSCNKPGKVFDANNKFCHSANVERLYQLSDKGLKLDLYTADPNIEYRNEKEWMQADVEGRNFTICAILIDRYGNVYDLTGRGLADLRANVLSAIQEPNRMLARDPVCMFAGFKKMVEGFLPDNNLEQALNNWQPTLNLDKQHIYAIVKKHLSSLSPEDRYKYVSFICKYNIHEKVFDFATDSPVDQVLAKLKFILTIDTAHDARLFNQPHVDTEQIAKNHHSELNFI